MTAQDQQTTGKPQHDLYEISENAQQQARRRLLRKANPLDDNLHKLLSKVREHEDYRPAVPQKEQILSRYDVDYFADVDPRSLQVWHPIEPPSSIVRNVFMELGGKNLEEQLTSVAFSNLGDSQFQNYCATLIQKSWRQYRIRKAYRLVVAAVVRIQRWWRRILKTRLRSFRVRNKAALVVQRFFRRWRDRRVFQFYKGLVTTRERLDPKILLRAINPRESELLDPAAGLHVRLRLGGSTWPPLIFYKIFTHTAVVDINAFAPRDYAKEREEGAKKAALLKAQQVNVHVPERLMISAQPELREYLRPDGSLGYRDVKGWYQRVENNGWRPLADRLLVEDQQFAIKDSKVLAKITYQPFTVLRKEERKRLAKQRKVEWLRKIYLQREGSGNSPSASASAAALSSAALPDDTDLDDLQGDDDLLRWTEALDFDSYADSWSGLAVTLGTASCIPKSHAETVGLGLMQGTSNPSIPYFGGASQMATFTPGPYIVQESVD